MVRYDFYSTRYEKNSPFVKKKGLIQTDSSFLLSVKNVHVTNPKSNSPVCIEIQYVP
jgi:hypothetical protein